MKKKVLTVVAVVGLLALGRAEMASAAFYYHYDASVTPDHSSLQSVFSTFTPPGTNWFVSDGELTINTTVLSAVNFGNASWDPVPWEIGDSSEGNSVSIRAKLMPNSEDWYVYLADGTYEAYVNFVPEQVLFWLAGGENTYTIDTSDYHWYSISLVNGQVIYSLDGAEVCSGAANLTGSVPGSTVDPTQKYLSIGDIWGSGDRGIGSFVVDDVIVANPVPLPSTVLLFGTGIAGLTGIRIRRKKQ